ncbi:MAG: response regulator transcription factor [Clostridia bacterium]|nr:response regulator transcription factor [Clostridia bacterium]
MAEIKILTVDDDDNICQLLKLYLVKEGYSTFICHNGKEALKKIDEEKFDLILLDIMMPDMDGYETLSAIRKFSDVPVILVSAKGEPMDKIGGLDIGADDYVTKPFEPQELISRIRAILRRIANSDKTEKTESLKDITVSSLYISIANCIVKIDDRKIEMPPKEMELLYFLASHPMKVYSRQQLLTCVWGADYKGDSRTVDVHIKRIREKLGENADWKLETVWRIGYKFEVYD